MSNKPSKTCSAVSNNPLALDGVDGRSSQSRRFRDLLRDIANEFGGAGAMPARAQSIARQMAALMVRSEQQQAAVVSGQGNPDELIRLSDQIRRLQTDLQSSQGLAELRTA